MENRELMAVMNDKLLLVHKEILMCPFSEQRELYIKKISDAVTELIVKDQRFIDAVGGHVAEKAYFGIEPLLFDCEDCGESEFYMRVWLSVNDQRTEFKYDYMPANCLVGKDIWNTPLVIYKDGGKSQLMQIFEVCFTGITPVQALDISRDENGSGDCVEKIFSEILGERDFKVY